MTQTSHTVGIPSDPLSEALASSRPRIGVDLLVISQFSDTGMVVYANNILEHLFGLLSDCDWFVFMRPGAPLDIDQGRYPHVQIVNSPWMRTDWGWKLVGVALEAIFYKLDVLFLPVSRAPLIKTCKLIVFIHDVGFLSLPEYLKKGTLLKTRLAMRDVGNKADLCLTNSLFTRSAFCNYYGLSEGKVEVTYLGFDETRFNSAPVDSHIIERVLARYGISKPYVLYLGVIQGRKNLVRLIEAKKRWTERWPNLQLVLAGSKGWNCVEIYEAAASTDDVVLTGRVETEDLRILYQNAECYVQPSVYEGFGMPVIEAMACGSPVVLSTSGALPEIGGNAAHYFDPEDVEAITEAIIAVIQEPGKRQWMRTAGLSRAKHFTWMQVARLTETAIRKVLTGA